MAMLTGIKTGSRSMTRSLEMSGPIWRVKRTLKMDYVVIASSMDELSEMIALAPGIPRLGAIFPDPSGWFIVKRVDPAQSKAVMVDGKQTMEWIVSVEMDNQIEAVDPTKLEPTVSWGSETQEVACRKDVKNGKDVQNAVGDPLKLARPITVPVLTISRYYHAANFSPEIIYSYTNTLNKKTFWGAPPYHVLLKDIQGKYLRIELPDGTKPLFFQATFKFKFRRDTESEEPWTAQVLHTAKKFKENGHTLQALSQPGNTPIEVRLGPNGEKLKDTDESYYLKFHIYEERDFTPLAINNTDIFR